MNQTDKDQFTKSNFGKWGWSIILYAFLLYYFNTGLSADAMNVIPDAYAGTYGMDRNLLLSFATPAGIVGVIGGIICGRLCMKTGAKKLSAAALIKRIGEKKVKHPSEVAGQANVLVFPDAASCNIGGKLVQFTAKCRSYGPLYQGFRLPILDCSRGMDEKIAYDNIAFLCVQAANSK